MLESKTIYLYFIALFCASLGCDAPESQTQTVDQQFTRLSAAQTGISFKNTLKETNKQNILTYEYFYNGGGVAVGDINNDGLVDIYFSANQGENKLYLNRGNFKFEDITKQAGVSAKSGWRTGVTMVDINHDGYLDIYLCRSGEVHPMMRENTLFINNKDLTFKRATQQYGLNDNAYSTTSAFLDYDRDGDLDMFLLNHSRLPLSNAKSITERYKNERVAYVGNKLYRNDNDEFVDVSDEMGIYGPVSNYGLGVTYSDVNDDGWPDLYTTNDYTEKDKFYLNQQGRFFKEVSDSLLTHMSQSSMGMDMADVNNDGLTDIFVLDMLPQKNEHQKRFYWQDSYEVYASMLDHGLHHQYMRNMLQLNNGDGTFSEIGQLAGISNTEWSWSALFADYDNDGLQDLFVSNGFMRNFTSHDFLNYKSELIRDVKRGKDVGSLKEILESVPSYATSNYMFRNENGITFSDVTGKWGLDGANLSNGTAYADLDNDGDLDLVVNNIDQEAGVYRNNAELSGNSYLKIRLEGSDNNTFGLGAKVTLYNNNELMTRTLVPYRGYQSSVEPTLFFGVGKAEKVDSLLVLWPRGERQLLKNVAANQTLTLSQEDAASSSTYEVAKKTPQIFTMSSQTLSFRHSENDHIDFEHQRLLPRMYSTQGPAAALADVNGDGVNDIYIGGAKGQSGVLFLQGMNGFELKPQPTFKKDADAEDTDAIFFDMDGDGDQDLYVVSGGYEYGPNDPLLQDRLYKNDGAGTFSKVTLPEMYSSGGCVRVADMDADGDLDVFSGGRIVPGRYPEQPQSFLLINDGKGNFSPANEKAGGAINDLGMVTDASWVNLNGDNYPDLIVVGEWMPVKILINEQGVLKNKSADYLETKTEGWWQSLLVDDFDGDGDQDFVAGNFGMNNQMKASPARPVTMYYADYDKNGTVDPLLFYFIGDRQYPSPTRDELLKQIPSFKSRFPDYESYTNATIEQLLTDREKEQSSILNAYRFESCYFENDNEKFSIKPLPVRAQVSPIMAMQTADVNRDGNQDIVTGGNITKMRSRFGMATGNFGDVWLGDGDGNFRYLPALESGISVRGDVRQILKDGDDFIFILNNDQPVIYKTLTKLQ